MTHLSWWGRIRGCSWAWWGQAQACSSLARLVFKPKPVATKVGPSYTPCTKSISTFVLNIQLYLGIVALMGVGARKWDLVKPMGLKPSSPIWVGIRSHFRMEQLTMDWGARVTSWSTIREVGSGHQVEENSTLQPKLEVRLALLRLSAVQTWPTTAVSDPF